MIAYDAAHDLPHGLMAHPMLLGRLPQPEQMGVGGDDRPALRWDGWPVSGRAARPCCVACLLGHNRRIGAGRWLLGWRGGTVQEDVARRDDPTIQSPSLPLLPGTLDVPARASAGPAP